MAIDFKLLSICAGGEHWTVSLAAGSGKAAQYQFARDEVRGEPSDDEMRATALTLLREMAAGKPVDKTFTDELAVGKKVTL